MQETQLDIVSQMYRGEVLTPGYKFVVTYAEKLNGDTVEFLHTHLQYEIYFVLENRIISHVEGQNHTLNKGDILFLTPKTKHHTVYEPGVKKDYFVLIFEVVPTPGLERLQPEYRTQYEEIRERLGIIDERKSFITRGDTDEMLAVLERIRREKTGRLIETMLAFAQLMHVFNVRHYKACATSAMREAENGPEVAALVAARTGIEIEIISGSVEADLAFAAGALEELMPQDRTYIHVDVGGGSTEIVVYRRHRKEASFSFPIGTLRILAGAVSAEAQEDFQARLAQIKAQYAPRDIIASGGNINKTLKLLSKQDGDSIDFESLERFHRDLSALSFEERLERYEMNSYRADVIVPALHIFLSIGRACQIENYIIPKVGLVDGIIRQLYNGRLEPRQAPVVNI